MNEETKQAPPLSIRLESCDTEVKMVYGLEMDLRRLLPDPRAAMQLVLHDTYTQDYIIRRCLTNSRKMVLTNEDLIPIDDLDISSEDVEKLLLWVVDHTLYFFMRRVEGLGLLAARFKMDPLNPSSPGSEASAS